MDDTESHTFRLWKKSAPEHQVQRVRRHNLPSTSRIIKYILLSILLLLTLGIYKKHAIFNKTNISSPDAHPKHANNTPEQPARSSSTPSNDTTIYPKFGKCTASFGGPSLPYDTAIASHDLHNTLHAYPHYILHEQMLRGLWSKHSYLLTVLGQELSKPEPQRLKWLLWHDRDTVLMNPQIPLDIFVPPEDKGFGHINLLVTKDRNGLNNGVFMVRVGQWAVKMLASVLSIREYRPDVVLKYTEQSGMEEVIKRPWWNSSVAYIPQRWFNGFPPNADVEHDNAISHSRPGSLLIHFASNRDGLRPQRMAQWGEVARKRVSEWDKPVEETYYLEEIAEYWERVGRNESFDSINRGIGRRFWHVPKVVRGADEVSGRA
ncbi:glycosyltransferase family 34 protein [Periconia macrospinosa]|uniref:Glycosyltransferase family 34 protein n=1 Tax=Periconia macrospinosa TaxID=97972 RepID=A0A2V1DWG8_9PLEO|nr:glycosyltransferase family 34 protein [Periconia macrospinosa]